MIHGGQPNRFQKAMLKRLDATLQQQYHQSLKEVLAELRLRNVLTDAEPAPETIFSIMVHAHVLGPRDSPSVRQMHRAIERLLSGTYGRCAQCGKRIPGALLKADPMATVCPVCRELPGTPSA